MFKGKKGETNTIKQKAVWVAGGLALTAAAFHFIPAIQKKLEDILYQKMK